MFLAAIGVPQMRDDGTFFDGKIFIEPFITITPAKRKSENREAGTLETKPMNVDAAIFQVMVLEKGGLLDRIQSTMAGISGEEILVQQDNASPHVGKRNREIINEEAQRRGLSIRFVNQPPQSPDLNKLDLCFFHSLNKQRYAMMRRCKSYDDIIRSVKLAFNNYSVDKLMRVHALQYVAYREILKAHGDNNY